MLLLLGEDDSGEFELLKSNSGSTKQTSHSTPVSFEWDMRNALRTFSKRIEEVSRPINTM